MAIVTNKNDILVKYHQLYGTNEPEVKHKPIRVDKLVASVESYCVSVSGLYCGNDEFSDDNYALNFEMWQYMERDIVESFEIIPSSVLYEHDTIGLTLEWYAKNPIYVSSKEEYVGLYESFIRFLEGVSHDSFDEFKIRYDLINKEKEELNVASTGNDDVLFTRDNFSCVSSTVLETHNSIISF